MNLFRSPRLYVFLLLVVVLLAVILFSGVHKGEIPYREFKRFQIPTDVAVFRARASEKYEQPEPYKPSCKGFTLISAVALRKASTELVLGFYKNKFPGIYRKDDNGSLELIVAAPSDSGRYASIPQKYMMAYDAKFQSYNNYHCLIYYHLSFIDVFSYEGRHLARLNTVFRVPFPSIILYAGNYVYERGQTFNSNQAAFVYEDKVYVVSSRSPYSAQLLLDCYSISSGDYIGSFYIGIPLKNTDVKGIFEEQGKLILSTYLQTGDYILEPTSSRHH